MRRMIAVSVAVASLAAAGCAVQPDLRTTPVVASFPTAMVPPSFDGLTARPESSASAAFKRVGRDSAVARGQVWTLRQQTHVVGSVQVSQLKGGLSTKSERVKSGIRGAINNGTYRWFVADPAPRQWVGVQTQPQLLIYLWMPVSRTDVYVVVQLKSSVSDPDRIVTDLIAYEESAR